LVYFNTLSGQYLIASLASDVLICNTFMELCKAEGFHSNIYEEFCLLGYNAV
jgi:hypothetical protein